MNSNNLYFAGRLITALKLGFLLHDLVVFRRKRKKYGLKVFSQVLAQ